MLGMLTCVFAEPQQPTQRRQELRTHAFPDLLPHHRQDLDAARSYFASEDVARSLLKPADAKLSFALGSQKSSNGPLSARPSMGVRISDPEAFLSEHGTTPFPKPSRSDSSRRGSHAESMSTTPEHHRSIHQTSSNLSAFAVTLPRPFQFSHSATSSPPNSNNRKRPSPTGSYSGATQSSIAWAPSSWISRGSIVPEDAKSTFSSSTCEIEDHTAPTNESTAKKPTLSLLLKNQDQFQAEGHATLSLLDPSQESKYQAWRRAYASYLDIWHMPIEMAQLMNYNRAFATSSSPQSPALNDLTRSCELDALDEVSALELANHCPNCSSILASHDEALSDKCLACHRLQHPPLCIYCNTYILGLSSPCVTCGHTMHFACRTEVNSSDLLGECVAGCGCACMEHQITGVPLAELPPQIYGRRKSRLRDVSPAITIVGDAKEPARIDEQEQAGWEDTAYVSLSKNLKGERRDSIRSLRAMGSQIWRGG